MDFTVTRAAEGDTVLEGVAETFADAVIDTDAVALVDGDSDGEVVLESVDVDVAVLDGECVPVCVSVCVALSVSDGEKEALLVWLRAALAAKLLSDTVALAVDDMVEDCDCVLVGGTVCVDD